MFDACQVLQTFYTKYSVTLDRMASIAFVQRRKPPRRNAGCIRGVVFYRVDRDLSIFELAPR